MLVRLMYASRAAAQVSHDATVSILKVSKLNNPKVGITGVLCFCETQRIFMQVLEGGRAQVSALYNRIVTDPRHTEVTLLSFEEVEERSFAGWSMGQVNMSRVNTALLLRYSETAALDPYAVSGRVSKAMFGELVATASVMGQA